MSQEHDTHAEIEALNARLDATNKRLDNLIDLLIGDEAEIYENRFDESPSIWQQLQTVKEDLDGVETSVASLSANVKARADGGSMTKKGRAKRDARNELLRRAAMNNSDGLELAHLPATDIIEMQKPEVDLKYQTVKDAFDELRLRWEPIYVKENPKRLVLLEKGLPRELVLSVEDDLGRDDLTKRLISGCKDTPG